MTFYYCPICKKFYTSSSMSFDVITKDIMCLNCYSFNVIEYKDKTFTEMCNIERLLKIKELKNK